MIENTTKLNTLYQLMSKTYLLNALEVRDMMLCIADILGLRLEKLNKDEMSAYIYKLGPYTMVVTYRLEEAFGLLNNSIHGVGLKPSPVLLDHLHKGRSVAYWDIRVFYGNYRVNNCSYLHITNLGYTLVGNTRVLTSIEKIVKLDTLKRCFKRMEEDINKRYNVYGVPSGFSTLIFSHYASVSNLYMDVGWFMQDNVLKLSMRFINKQSPEKAVLEVLVHNFDSTDNLYQMYVKVLGKDYKLKDRDVKKLLDSDTNKDRFIDGLDKTLKNRLIKRIENNPEDVFKFVLYLL